MRSITTFILRVFTDDQLPGLVRGTVQTAITGELHSFQDAHDLLRWITQAKLPDTPPPVTSDDAPCPQGK